MNDIRLDRVTKIFDGEPVLRDLSLTISGGTFFALLGPSGSGKTTLLRLIAGLEQPDGGKITIGGKDITGIPTHKRRVNTVFQHYALFPHLTVFENVAYGLMIRSMAADAVEESVMAVLRRVNLVDHARKYIHQLSGGQQQRVALARAIVNKPQVLLLDEPLAALDFKLRERMLLELIELQDDLKTTFIYITHDQFEALTVADTMAIMNHEGAIEQIGTPKEIYEFPTSSFAASFVGSTNMFEGVLRVTGKDSHIDIDRLGRLAIAVPADKRWLCSGSVVFMSVRPEKIEISKTKLEGFANELGGVVESVVYYGRSTQYNVRLSNGAYIQAFEQNAEHFPQEVIDYDDKVYLYWQRENAVLLDC